MGSMSLMHWLVVIGVIVVLFGGRGKVSGIMGEFAKGIKAFKSGMREPDEETTATTAHTAQVSPPGAAAAGAAAAAAERPREHA
jgi:sec-independent protein translocase protein TatA